ncbi:hypothetical protein OG883_06765 [Streptomyces sp. NBC_01142]|uniref:hypothetical protein n=1 Tax=Streptomyces sp. NBC_01142 TaxID=2975865 RepID=UPI0022579DE2|nr:hypothetical protein [Streptomyces sp. NBC_01142]MCX4819611.1 hypothetical protein [Streptomyces sp. NBC_01142]
MPRPLPLPPANAALLAPPAGMAAVRHFARLRAETAGLGNERVALAETLAGEAVTWLLARGAADAEIRVWEEPGAVVWDLLGLGREQALPGPFAGFAPPGPEPSADDALWLLRTLSEFLDVRVEPGGGLRLRAVCAGPRVLTCG